MGDSLDDMIAMRQADRAIAKRQRLASWHRRGKDLATLKAAGFEAKALDPSQQHYRVKLPGYGFVDFWPSSWRWHEKRKGDTRPRHSGFGLESMIARLKQIPQG